MSQGSSNRSSKARVKVRGQAQVPADPGFAEIVTLIQAAKERAYHAVNTALIGLYWQVGEYISRKLAAAEWGNGVVTQLAAHLANTQPGLRGFTRANLFRMRQFYEAYRDDEKVAPLVRQLPWTHNLIILSQSKRPEEREFYLRAAAREQWSKRELERQFAIALFERAVLTPAKVSPVVRQSHPQALSVFKDAYLLEFLGLPEGHSGGRPASRAARPPQDFPDRTRARLLLCQLHWPANGCTDVRLSVACSVA